jgi:hypothetical protein
MKILGAGFNPLGSPRDDTRCARFARRADGRFVRKSAAIQEKSGPLRFAAFLDRANLGRQQQ